MSVQYNRPACMRVHIVRPMFEQLSIKFATEQADGVLLNPDEEYSTDQSDILTRERGTCECG